MLIRYFMRHLLLDLAIRLNCLSDILTGHRKSLKKSGDVRGSALTPKLYTTKLVG